MAITVNGTNGFTTDNGALKLDTDTLVVDDTNNRVGIGTATPSTTLDVGGTIYSSGVIRNTNGGSAAVPSIQPGNDNDTGIYHPATNTIGFSTVGTERMRINSSGIVTKPNQPSFWAYCSADTNINVNSGTTVQFDSERFDVGSNFDTSTYTFTAPVTGKYFLSAGCRIDLIDTAASYYRLRMLVSNKEVGSIIDPNFSADLNYYTRDISSVFDMDANDTASVNVLQSAGHTSSHVNSADVYTWFAGYLLG